MPNIKPGTITQFILSGKKALLDEAKDLIELATTHEDALINLRTIECEQQSYSMISNAKSSYVPKGIFGGGVAGMTRALVETGSSLLTGIAAGAMLGGSAALMVDKVDDCLTKAHAAKRNEEVTQLLIAANLKLNFFKLRESKLEESKPVEVNGLSKKIA